MSRSDLDSLIHLTDDKDFRCLYEALSSILEYSRNCEYQGSPIPAVSSFNISVFVAVLDKVLDFCVSDRNVFLNRDINHLYGLLNPSNGPLFHIFTNEFTASSDGNVSIHPSTLKVRHSYALKLIVLERYFTISA